MGEKSTELPANLCEKGITDEDTIREIIGALVTGSQLDSSTTSSDTERLIKTEGVV